MKLFGVLDKKKKEWMDMFFFVISSSIFEKEKKTKRKKKWCKSEMGYCPFEHRSCVTIQPLYRDTVGLEVAGLKWSCIARWSNVLQ